MAPETITDVEGAPAVHITRSIDVEFAAFFEQTKHAMHRLAFLLTGSNAQAEETVQESFVRVYERWPRIDDPAAYLRTAVVNRCSSWHRHRAVVRRTQSQVATAESYIDHPDELADALARLPPRRRAVLVLRYYERLDTAEIADVLGISVGTVKSTLHRALAQLKGDLR